jgi:hypothetical protein
MTVTDVLIADLRQYMAAEVPYDIAYKVLAHAVTEMPPCGGAGWVIKRAAYIIRQHGAPATRAGVPRTPSQPTSQ